ncbi:interferon-induced protein with tetratricopeptide repeats 3 [Manis pentadactyla]|uniref:interferon-induced protein with tetratricopeptide repeats 3 n=1 Tax=Manis pentadactyla TaxID=143292 RepID=UPI00255CDF7E|nr:interferon-induced protein with tetratricopeptide repeats 3 [Manis pentadactyla]
MLRSFHTKSGQWGLEDSYWSKVSKNSLDKILPKLKCHFTWNLFKGESISHDLEDRVCNQIEFLNTEFKPTMYNLLAYVKHLRGQNEAALECLGQAEELIQREHSDQAEIRSLVTWGNYAWVYYHLGRLSEAQTYADKVKQVCEKFSNPYSIECPELDCEEGWTRLKCGERQNERAKVCFEKALEEKPDDPEFSSGLAIAMYCLDKKPQNQFSVKVLKQAIELSPNNEYIKVLLALKLQKMNEKAEGEQLVAEALEKAPCQTDVLCSAAKFYKRKGDLDKAIELFLKALESLPNNGYLHYQIAYCYKAKVKQIQNTGELETSGHREKIEGLRKCAVGYLTKTIEKGLDPQSVHPDLIGLLETEENRQIVIDGKELPSTERQQLYQRYSIFRAYCEKSEDTAVQHYSEGLPITTVSTEKEKMKYQLQNIGENQLPRNAPNSWYLQGLIHKLNGDLLQAAKCYEKALGHVLRNSPSGIGSLFLSASELEGGSEEMGQDAELCSRRTP